MKCRGDKSNDCTYARKCPYHSDRERCAEAVRKGTWGKRETKSGSVKR